MFNEMEQFFFDVFMLAFRLMWKITWRLLRPILPDLIRFTFVILSYPISWAFIFVASLWAFTDHTIAPSLIAVAAIVASALTHVLRPGLR